MFTFVDLHRVNNLIKLHDMNKGGAMGTVKEYRCSSLVFHSEPIFRMRGEL